MITATARVDMTPAEGLAKGGLRKATRIGINRAAAPVKAEVVGQADAVKLRGYTGKAIRIRVRMYPNDRAAAIVGPSTKYTRKKGKFKRGKRKGEPRVFKPSKYAHLSNAGTRRSRALHWLDKANDVAGPRFVNSVGGEILGEIDKQLARKAGG